MTYNERKVDSERGEALYHNRIDDPTEPMATFQIYERANIRTHNLSFHASFNPSEKDFSRMSEKEVVDFIKDWMGRMGYGNQPYIIYRHNDRDRIHYHVASIRVDENGRKIDSWRENKRSLEAMRSLSEKYGFDIGKAEKSETTKEAAASKVEQSGNKKQEEPKRQHPAPPHFDPSKGHVRQQVTDIVNCAALYHFTTTNQFALILQDLDVQMQMHPHGSGRVEMVFHGIDPETGKTCTVPMRERSLKVPSHSDIQARAESCRHSIHTRERSKVRSLATRYLEYSRTEGHYANLLRKKGITVHYNYDGDGRIAGATFIDHQTRSAFKASEVGLSAATIRARAEGEWRANEKGGEKEKNDAVSRTQAQERSAVREGARIDPDAVLGLLEGGRSRRAEDEEYMRKARSKGRHR